MLAANFYVAWLGVFAGLLLGALVGMFFHRDEWLGGYASWRRRMIRLAHIAMIGTGLLNLAFVLSVQHLGLDKAPTLASVMFIVGAVTMPTVCLLAAWRKGMRYLFFVPAASLLIAVADFMYEGLLR